MDLPRHCRDGLRGPSASFQMHFLVFMLFSGFLLVAADTGLRSRFWSLGGSLYPAWRVAAGGYRRHSLLHFAQRRPDCPNLSQRWLFASWTTYRLRGLAQSAGFSLWHHLWARLHPDRQVPTGSSQRRALFHLSPRWQYHTDLPRCHSKCKRSLCVFLVRVVWGVSETATEDGTRHTGPRQDWGLWGITAGPASGVTFGDRWASYS